MLVLNTETRVSVQLADMLSHIDDYARLSYQVCCILLHALVQQPHAKNLNASTTYTYVLISFFTRPPNPGRLSSGKVRSVGSIVGGVRYLGLDGEFEGRSPS